MLAEVVLRVLIDLASGPLCDWAMVFIGHSLAFREPRRQMAGGFVSLHTST